MAVSLKRPARTESLTIRLDPKTRFALEFVARIKGQSITMVVERAIKQAADSLRFSNEHNDGRSWIDYWNVVDGVRAIRLAQDQDTNPTFDEDEKLDFIKTHWAFFSVDPNLVQVRAESLDVLWPMIDELVFKWRETKAADRMAVATEMQGILRKAGAWVPAWPQSKAAPASKKKLDLEDEIPF